MKLESRECLACGGEGLEVRARGTWECRFCEGRGWTLGVECCSCGRPAAQIVEKEGMEYALCEREECGKKFKELASWEFENVDSVRVDESSYEDWERFGV